MQVSTKKFLFSKHEKMFICYLGKVHVTGPGIEHGVLATFQSHFICDTKGAGKTSSLMKPKQVK
jgi:hypothetical protein